MNPKILFGFLVCASFLLSSTRLLCQSAFDFSSLPNTKNPYKIKVPAKKKAMRAYQTFAKKVKPQLIQYNDTVYLHIPEGYAPSKKFFTRRRDGFVVENVQLNQYDCDSNNYYSEICRRNRNGLFAGDIKKPLYKKYIFNHLLKPDSTGKLIDFTLNLGLEAQNYYVDKCDFNLLILKRRRIVDVWYFGSICADPVVVYQPLLLLAELEEMEQKVLYQPLLKYDTLRMFIPFERNEVTIPKNYTDHLEHFVSKPNKEILRAQITAYASVEGTAEINRLLYRQRAEPLAKIIKKYADTSTLIQERVGENWNLFFKQIKSTSDSFLLSMDTLQLQSYISDTAKAKRFDDLLSKQRYTSVLVISKPKVTVANIDSFAVAEFTNIVNLILKNYQSGKWSEIPKRLKNRLTEIQRFLLNRFIEDAIAYETIEKLPLHQNLNVKDSKEKLFETLIYNKLLFEYLHFRNQMDQSTLLQYLNDLRKYPNAPPGVIYNYYALQINEGIIIPSLLSSLKNDLPRIEKTKFDSARLSELTLFYHHHNAMQNYHPFSLKIKNKARQSNLYIFKHYLKESNDSKRLTIAKHLVAYDMYKQALEMIDPLINRQYPNHEAMKFRLSILYSSYQGVRNNDFYSELIQAASILTPEEWCGLFTGSCNLNFQLLDYPPLFELYCKKQSELFRN